MHCRGKRAGLQALASLSAIRGSRASRCLCSGHVTGPCGRYPLQDDRLSVEKGLSGVVLKFARPWSRSAARRVSAVVLLLWAVQMAALVNRSYLQASPNLATDLARYGSNAQWRGVYYRGEKIGFTVSQTVPVDDGFELQEDGQLQMTLLGATTAGPACARRRAWTRASRCVRSSSRWTPVPARRGARPRERPPGLALDVVTASGTRTEQRELAEPPMLTLNLARRLASGGLTCRRPAPVDASSIRPRCATHPWSSRSGSASWCAPATRPIPAFRVEPGVRRSAHDVVGDRHRRGDPRGEPARPDLDPGIRRSGAGHGGAEAGDRRTCCRPRRSCR